MSGSGSGGGRKNLRAIPTLPDGVEPFRAPLEGDGGGDDGGASSLVLPDRLPTGPVPGAPIDLPDQKSNLERIYNSVGETDPARAAQVIGLSRRLSEPEAYIDHNLDDVKKIADAPPTSLFQQLEAQYPGTTKFLAEPSNMAVAKDDIPNLAAHEGVINAVAKAHGIIDAVRAGYQNSVTGLVQRGKAPDITLDRDPTIAEGFFSGLAGLFGDAIPMAAGGIAGALAGGATAGPLGATAGAGIGGFALPAAIRTALLEHYQKGDIKDASDFWNRAYDITKESAKQGLVGLLTAGAGGLVGKLGGGLVPKLVAEAATMTTAGKAVEGQMPTPRDYLENLLLIGGVHALTTGAGQAGAKVLGSAADRFSSTKTDQSAETYSALGKVADASKLRERLPDTYREQVGNLTAGTSVENVYLPVKNFDEYFQSKQMDPAAIARELGVEDGHAEARETGGDLQVPYSTWLEKVAGTPHYDALAQDVKFNPDDLTVRERNDRVAAVQKEMADIEAQQSADAEASARAQAFAESAARIRDTISQQLEAAGRPADEARYQPQLVESVLRTLGAKLGVDPQALLDRFPLQIQRDEAAPATAPPGEQSLEQAARPVQEQLGTRRTQTVLPDQVPVVSLPTDRTFEGLAPEDVRARSMVDAKSARRGTVTNRAEGWKIALSGEGLKKAANYAVRPEQALGLRNLRTLVENAQYVRSDQRPRGIVHDYLYAPFEHDGQEYLAKIVVENVPADKSRRVSEHQKFYSLHVMKMGDSPSEAGQTIGLPGSPEGVAPSDGRTIPLPDFLSRINKAREITENYQSSDEGPRGRIRIGGADFNIDLFKNADASTALHEMGHYFLEVLGHVASDEKAPQDVKDDYAAALKFLGVERREDVGREQHEKWARAFERYLADGQAPSTGLRAAFARFRDWLVSVYKDLRNLNVELSPEIRGVFDRLLATQDEIAHARMISGLTEELPADIPPEVARRLADLHRQAREAAETQLLKEQMAELTEKNRKFLDSERERATKEATAEAKDLPLYRAADEVKKATRKTAAEQALLFLEDRIPDKAVAAFEAAAENHGFGSGEELARKLVEADTHGGFDGEVRARVEQKMVQHADLKDTDKIRAKALEAVHNERSTELLALEREALAGLVDRAGIRSEAAKRNREQARIDARAAESQARDILSKKPLKDATASGRYVTAERSAAVRAAKALARKDYDGASSAKREQMLNHALAREAMRNKSEAEKAIASLSDPDRFSDLRKMPYGFMRQVDQLLARFGFADPKREDLETLSKIADDMAKRDEDPGEIANATGLVQDARGAWVPETLPDFVERVNENYYGLSLPDSVMLGVDKPFRELTMQALRELHDSVETISRVGKNYDRFLTDFDTADMKEAARQLRESVEKEVGTPYAEKMRIGSKYGSGFRDKLDGVLNLPDAAIPEMVNVLTLTHYLDGAKEDGPAKEYIYRPIKEAEDRKIQRYEKMTKDLNALLEKHFTPKELAAYKERREFVEPVGRYMSREELLSMALNWGNEGNRDRIRRGYGLEDGQVQQILDRLDKKEWDFAQDVWDYLDTFWPDIKALEMKVRGVDPERVAPAEIQTKHGAYRGGYYPIFYDFERSSDAFRNAEQKNALYKQYSSAFAQTDSGHTMERVTTVKRPVRLSMDVLFNHLENVVHDLEYRAPVIDVNRFLRQRDSKAALENAIGVKGYRAIENWLKSVASDQGEFLSVADRVFRWFRFNTTFAQLGLRVFRFPIDLTGHVANAAWEMGPTRLLGAIKAFASDPKELKAFVDGKSDRMRNRGKLLDRDLMDISRKWSGRQSMWRQYAFIFHNFADEAISYPLWNEVYKRALAEHGDEKAKHIADEAVTRTIGSGSILDQVGAQRGGEGMKVLSMFYSWSSMMFNRAWLSGKLAGLDYDRGNVGKALTGLAKATFYAWGIQALSENFWKELFRNPQSDDEDEKKKRILSRTLEQPFSYVWLARDIAGYAIDKAIGGDPTYRLSPLESAIENVLKPFGEAANIAFTDGKEFDQKFGEHAARAAATMAGYPQQANALAFNFLDWAQGNGEASWRDLLQRRTQK